MKNFRYTRKPVESCVACRKLHRHEFKNEDKDECTRFGSCFNTQEALIKIASVKDGEPIPFYTDACLPLLFTCDDFEITTDEDLEKRKAEDRKKAEADPIFIIDKMIEAATEARNNFETEQHDWYYFSGQKNALNVLKRKLSTQ